VVCPPFVYGDCWGCFHLHRGGGVTGKLQDM
jgi:hypothetical protein